LDESNAFLFEIVLAFVPRKRRLSEKNFSMKGRLRELLIAVIDGDKKASIYHEHGELSDED
jgi:hypothetical protein